MPKAVFCACNSWVNHSQVGSHHLARGLARKGWQIAFISDPISPAHVLGGVSPELRARARLWSSGGAWCEERIFTWLPATLIAPHNKPILREPWVAQSWHRLTLPSIRTCLAKQGFDAVDLLYVDSLTQAYWWNELALSRRVLRIADDFRGFSKFTSAGQQALEHIARHVDTVVYSAPPLGRLAEGLAPGKAFFLPNGVDVGHFRRPAPCPPEYAQVNRPIVVYVGAIDEWFDFDLVDKAASHFPNYMFVLIGPDKLARARLGSRKNISILGPRPFVMLPQYLQHAHIGIIPFNVLAYEELIRSVNPLKLYEYMAAGLPVVSTRWETLEKLASPAILAETAEDFCDGLESALAQKAVLGKAGRLFVTTHDWSNRVDMLLQHLGW